MPEIEFETDTKNLAYGKKLSKGKVQDKKTSNLILLMAIILMVIATIFFISRDSQELPTEDMHTIGSPNGEAYYPNIK